MAAVKTFLQSLFQKESRKSVSAVKPLKDSVRMIIIKRPRCCAAQIFKTLSLKYWGCAYGAASFYFNLNYFCIYGKFIYIIHVQSSIFRLL